MFVLDVLIMKVVCLHASHLRSYRCVVEFEILNKRLLRKAGMLDARRPIKHLDQLILLCIGMDQAQEPLFWNCYCSAT